MIKMSITFKIVILTTRKVLYFNIYVLNLIFATSEQRYVPTGMVGVTNDILIIQLIVHNEI